MFDFEEWTNKVFELTDLIEQAKKTNEDTTQYQRKLNECWEEMIQQDDDFAVRFLKSVLSNMKHHIHGNMSGEQFHQFLHEMRDKSLQRDHS